MKFIRFAILRFTPIDIRAIAPVPQSASHICKQLSLRSVNAVEMIVFEHDPASFVADSTIRLEMEL